MQRWSDLKAANPELAEGGRNLLYQFGPGLGFLAAIRKDGGPRLHPICPIIIGDGLYTFIIPSPKLHDLRRDGRYALHSYPPVEVDDEFCVTGRAVEIMDPAVRRAVQGATQHDVAPEEGLFELMIERCMLATYRHRGDWPPTYTIWTSPIPK
jgi:hypothetical protein